MRSAIKLSKYRSLKRFWQQNFLFVRGYRGCFMKCSWAFIITSLVWGVTFPLRSEIVPPAKVLLKVGESKSIDVLEGANLRVSQKGVVDLLPLAEGKWQVTGLKTG